MCLMVFIKKIDFYGQQNIAYGGKKIMALYPNVWYSSTVYVLHGVFIPHNFTLCVIINVTEKKKELPLVMGIQISVVMLP